MNKIILGKNLLKNIYYNNSSKLLQTIKDLKTKIETIKKENERILRV